MNDTVQFVIRPRPLALESEAGYYIRVAEANAYGHAGAISTPDRNDVASSDVVGGKYSQNSFARRRRLIEERLGLEPGTFDLCWPVPSSIQNVPVKIGSLTFSSELRRRGTTRICPACVEEDGYLHALWEIRAYVACHRHRRRLLSECHACGQSLSAGRGTLLGCGCGMDYRRSPPATAARETLAFSELLGAAVEGRPILFLDNHGPLSSGTAGERLWALYAMGSMLEPGKSSVWLGDPASSTERSEYAVVNALSLFSDWPSKWIAHLNKRLSADRRERNQGMREIIGREMSRMERFASKAPEMDTVFRRWLINRFPGVRGREGKKTCNDEFMTVPQAAIHLGCSESYLRTRIRDSKLPATSERHCKQPMYLIDESLIESERCSRTATMTVKKAAADLKVGVKVIRALCSAGVLPNVSGKGRGATGIPVNAINELHNRLERSIAQKPRKSMALHAVLAKPGMIGVGTAGVIAEILAGKLELIAYDRSAGLSSIEVSKISVLRAQVSVKPACWLSRADTKKLLALDAAHICLLLRVGLLRPASPGSTDVSHASCLEFKQQFINLSELAALCERKKMHVAKRLKWAQVPRLTVNWQAISTYYPRAEAVALIRTHILPSRIPV